MNYSTSYHKELPTLSFSSLNFDRFTCACTSQEHSGNCSLLASLQLFELVQNFPENSTLTHHSLFSPENFIIKVKKTKRYFSLICHNNTKFMY